MVVSRHQTTQQYAPKPKASARKKKGDSASSTTPPTPTPTTTAESAPRLSATAKGKQPSRATTLVEPSDVQRTEAEQLKIVLRMSRQETHISQQHGSGTDEGTGSKPGVPDVPSDDSEEELSWNSSDDEDVGSHEEGKKYDESDDDRDEGSDDDSEETVKAEAGKDDDDDDNDEEEELAKDDEEDKETGKGGDEEESNDEEEQDLRLSEEARIQEEEDADKLYRDVNINQGRGLQVTQNVEDTHVTLTPVNPDGPQESSSMSSFVSSMLNPTCDVGVESIFTTASSLIVSLQTPTPIMTPSTIATITTSSEAPIPPPTIPSIILENLPTFNSAFRFEERLRSLETSFSEYRQSNLFADVVSAILGIVQQFMTQQMMKAVREQRREDDDQEGPFAGSNRGSKRQKEGGEHAPASTPSEKATEGAGRSTTGSQSRQMSASKSAFAEEPVQTTCQMEEPPHPVFETGADDQPIVQTSQHPEWLNVDTLTPELLAGPTYELMRGSCTSLTELEYQLEEEVSKHQQALHLKRLPGVKAELPKGLNLDNCLPPLPLIPDNRGRRVIPFDHFINIDLEFLQGGASSRKYTTFVTKTKAADYGHIKWIEDLVPRAMWIQQPIDYNKYALWGVSHWGRKRHQIYGYAVNRESVLDVYSKRRIIAVTELQIVKWHDYKHFDWIPVRRDDDQIYKFKEGDFKRLRLQDIEDMLLLL
nr:hypothetical protein [Tanacetum cinerariifolium]